MEFFTTKNINLLIKSEYFNFIEKYYSDILSNPNKYIHLAEDSVATYLGGGYAKLLDSGTTALQFGLLSLGVGPGDEVILPANTYSATAICITNIGAKPIFCDINLSNYTIDVDDIRNKITSRTKVIIPVHIYGYSANMRDILSIASDHHIKVLEDASHAFGGEYFGQKLGTIGDVGAFSCHMSKNFGTFGNGGLFYTKDKSLLEKISNYIYPDNQSIEVLRSGRTPANIGAMDALVLLFKLNIIESVIEGNLKLYKQYLKLYAGHDLRFPDLDLKNNRLHIRNFTVLSDNRDIYIQKGLAKQYYDINLMRSNTFAEVTNGELLKNTEEFFDKNLSFNFYFGGK